MMASIIGRGKLYSACVWGIVFIRIMAGILDIALRIMIFRLGFKATYVISRMGADEELGPSNMPVLRLL